MYASELPLESGVGQKTGEEILKLSKHFILTVLSEMFCCRNAEVFYSDVSKMNLSNFPSSRSFFM